MRSLFEKWNLLLFASWKKKRSKNWREKEKVFLGVRRIDSGAKRASNSVRPQTQRKWKMFSGRQREEKTEEQKEEKKDKACEKGKRPFLPESSSRYFPGLRDNHQEGLESNPQRPRKATVDCLSDSCSLLPLALQSLTLCLTFSLGHTLSALVRERSR